MAKKLVPISVVKGNKIKDPRKENWKFYISESSRYFNFVASYMNKLKKYPYNSIFRNGEVIVDFDISQGNSNHVNTIYSRGANRKTAVLPITFSAPKSWHETIAKCKSLDEQNISVDGDKMVFSFIAHNENPRGVQPNGELDEQKINVLANGISSEIVEQLLKSDKLISKVANNVSLKLAAVLSTKFNRFSEETKSLIKSGSQQTSDETTKKIFRLMKQAGWFD